MYRDDDIKLVLTILVVLAVIAANLAWQIYRCRELFPHASPWVCVVR